MNSNQPWESHVQWNLSWKTGTPLTIKIWSLQTGGLWWQVHIHWNVGPAKTSGPSRQVVYHGSGASRHVLPCNIIYFPQSALVRPAVTPAKPQYIGCKKIGRTESGNQTGTSVNRPIYMSSFSDRDITSDNCPQTPYMDRTLGRRQPNVSNT